MTSEATIERVGLNMFDKENIMMIEYDEKYGRLGAVSMIALYNQTKITEADVEQVIAGGVSEHLNKVILITKSQYENVFMSKENG